MREEGLSRWRRPWERPREAHAHSWRKRSVSAQLLDRLRSATRDAHGTLEGSLALLQPPLRRERFVEVLQGFLVFHRAWEPRVAALLDDDDLLAPQR